ncbi:MAG: FAD binding domain-containing protein [Chloroflexi bacterium]|nr:FAD binding domain-containing protein [Chloroflexota bacterium]
MWNRYLQPTSLAEALQALAEYRDSARVINGGTDLIIEIERKLRAPSVVVDISRIPGLDAIRVEGGVVSIGAGVTHNQIVNHPLLRERAFALARACWEVGAPQIRNRGTVAGNLVTASPANDTITPLWALDATVTLTSARGQRHLTFPEFYKGVRKTALAPDEILTEIAFDLPPAGALGTFLKLGLRRAQAISVVNVAVVLNVAADARIVDARIALGSIAPTIVRATQAEQSLVGHALDDAAIDEAARLSSEAAKPIDDVRGTAEYRRAMVQALVARGLRQLRGGTEQDDFPARPVMLWGGTDGHFPPLRIASHPSSIETTVNGRRYTVNGGHDKTLLRFLREDLHLTGTKEGCAEGECGSCTVILDGIAVMSCLVPAPRADGAAITTIEGLAKNGALHPLQRAFIDEGGVQCGYCTPGFIMSGASLLDEKSSPTQADMQQAITGNLCRCTGYVKILKAMETAARLQGQPHDSGAESNG